MEYLNIIILAVIQGLTEFLPVSSSGHLILAPMIFDFQDQGLALDAILHLGTLMAIVIYFREDLAKLLFSLFDKNSDPLTRRLAWYILVATVPAGLAGLFFGEIIQLQLRSSTFVATNLLIWSGVFWIADRAAKKRGNHEVDLREMGFRQVLLIGFAQALALLPGTSRSGITIAAGLFTHLSHTAAARFSFLLGTPIIIAAGFYELAAFFSQPREHFIYNSTQLGIGFLVTFVVGYISIKILLSVVARVGLFPFIIYRVILAVSILIFLPK